MNALSYGREVTVNAKDNSDNYLIKITLSGKTQVRQLDSCFDTRANTICVLNSSRPLEDTMSSDCDLLIVQIRGEDVRSTLEHEFGIRPEKHLEFLPYALNIKGDVGSFTQMILRMCQDLDRGQDPGQRGFSSKNTRRLLSLYSLMHLPHNYSEQIGDVPLIPSKWYMSRIEDYIEQHLAETISISDLAKVASTSVRSLQKSFSKSQQLSPMHYLRNKRLDHARELILKSSQVSDAATASGFSHMGRFSEYYRRRFGELPSETSKVKLYIF